MNTLNKGFTLIELMVTVAIVAVLAVIAAPSYVDYLRRGKIPEGLAGLSHLKVQMEQSFSDNRNYTAQCTAINASTPPDPAGKVVGKFLITCVSAGNPAATPPEPHSFTLTATGSELVNGFVYTINNQNIKTTTGTGAWGKDSTGADSCWVLKSDGSC